MPHKTQALPPLGASVRIRKRRRQEGGEFVILRDYFWREDEPWVVVQLPSGRRMPVPVSSTDLPAASFSREKEEQLLPTALIPLAQLCQTLRLSSKEQSVKRRMRNRK
jgi:hypothetical protein